MYLSYRIVRYRCVYNGFLCWMFCTVFVYSPNVKDMWICSKGAKLNKILQLQHNTVELKKIHLSMYTMLLLIQCYIGTMLYQNNVISEQCDITQQCYITTMLYQNNVTSQQCFITTMLYHNNAFSEQCYITTMLHHNNAIAPQCYIATMLYHNNAISQQCFFRTILYHHNAS